MASTLRRSASEKPTRSRCLFATALIVCAASTVRAQQTTNALTEDAVVALALARAAVADVTEGAVEAEDGRAGAVRAYPNPELAYTREQTYGPSGTGEDYLSIAQTIDLANRRGLRGRAGDARARAARHEGDAVRLAIAADARRRFYEALFRTRRVAALEHWLQHVEDAVAIVAHRERAGDAAVYDRRRLERERAVAHGRLAVERSALEAARARLRVLVGLSEAPRLDGELLPESDHTALVALRSASASRPDLLALALRIDAASIDERAAIRGWIPDLRIEAGWKGVDLGAEGRSDGFQLGVSLAIPLWDRSSGLARIARGSARAERGRLALLEAELEGELAARHAALTRLLEAAASSRRTTVVASEDLVRIASAGYEGGELGLLELLDAYRGAAEDVLDTLDMELAARLSRIELDRLTGADAR